MATQRDDRSLGELVGELAEQTGLLIRQELRQAGVELSQRVGKAGKDGGRFAAGAAMLHVGLLAVAAAIVLALGQLGVSWWLAALIVGVVLGGAGYGVARQACAAIKQADLLPRHAIGQLKDDQEWVKEQLT